jgi:predicted regulator of Ras-like GTPase activity (Roadblock/LC7/MglB family)
MSFSDVLAEATHSVEGAIAIGLVGIDGMGVETYTSDSHEFDVERAEVELAGLMGNISRTAKTLEAGKIKDIFVEADSQSYLLSIVDPNYFLLVALEPGANLGRARYEIKKVVQKLQSIESF